MKETKEKELNLAQFEYMQFLSIQQEKLKKSLKGLVDRITAANSGKIF